MNKEILRYCLEKGVLLDKDTFNLFSDFDDDTIKKLVGKFLGLKEKIITKSLITHNVDKIREVIDDERLIEKIKINFGLSFEISRERYTKEKIGGKKEDESFNGNIKVIYSLANLSKKIEVGDFVRYFRVRYSEIKQMLQERKELSNLISINRIGKGRQNFSIIGIVLNKTTTKNKNILLEVEDLTGRIKVLIHKDKADVYEMAKEVVVDDILGLKGSGSDEFFFVNEIFYPGAYLQEKNRLEKDESAAFISDIHVGSKNFLEINFSKFISWINGELGDEKQKEEARRVKYLFITGDTIDGVGIFPGQEELLEIKDITKQYEKLAGHLSRIRKDVAIIMCPGQHDAVRVAEPQPPVGRDYALPLYDLDNLILVSNPAVIEICNNGKRGIKVLMYHGASMTSFVSEIESLRLGKAHNFPAKVVKEILKRRHLAPIHSSVTYIPCEKSDPLLIKEIPDVINTADFHRPDVDVYNNILIVCSSCWQSITPFEEKVGNHPDPCKVPVLNLKTREIKILDFSDGEDRRCEEEDGKMVCEAGK